MLEPLVLDVAVRTVRVYTLQPFAFEVAVRTERTHMLESLQSLMWR